MFTNTQRGRLEVTKIVDWNGQEPDPDQTFEICIQGLSYPLGTEPAACQTAGHLGETLIWENVIPGTYTVTETDPGVDWIVEITGSPATVVPGGTAYATVTKYREYWASRLASGRTTPRMLRAGMTPGHTRNTPRP